MPEIASLFVRVHKSFIVNTNSVRAFNKADNGYVELDTGQSIPIGGLYRNQILELFNR